MAHFVTARQLRCARAALNWRQTEVAEMTGVSVPSIKRLETSEEQVAKARQETIRALVEAYEKGGIHFTWRFDTDGETDQDMEGISWAS